MNTFIPDPSFKPYLDIAAQLITQASGIGVRGYYLPPPALPPIPTDPIQRAFYLNIIVPMKDALDRFNANQSALAAAEDAAAQWWFQQMSSGAP